MPGTNWHRGVLRFADLAHLLNCGFPRPGLPDAVHQTAVSVSQLTGVIPAQFIQTSQNFAVKPGLTQRLLHKLRVIVFLDILILHDVDKRTCTAVLPGTRQFVDQPFSRVVSLPCVTTLGPSFENQTGFGMTRCGIGVVLIHLQSTFIHTEIHTPRNHMMPTTLPGKAQARPEDFRDIKQRQQVVVFQHLVGRMQIHQVQLVGGFNQLLLGALGNGEVLMGVLINHMPIRQHVGFLQRILLIQPFTVKLPVIFQSRAANFQRVIGDLRLR